MVLRQVSCVYQIWPFFDQYSGLSESKKEKQNFITHLHKIIHCHLMILWVETKFFTALPQPGSHQNSQASFTICPWNNSHPNFHRPTLRLREFSPNKSHDFCLIVTIGIGSNDWYSKEKLISRHEQWRTIFKDRTTSWNMMSHLSQIFFDLRIGR